MASAQTRIAETVALFYTADRTSDVSLIAEVEDTLADDHRELWRATPTSLLSMSWTQVSVETL
jgi:hypothetical protein